MTSLPPEGTAALLFTDMEQSTRLARDLGPAWIDVVEAHDALLHEAITAHGGHVERTEGDAFFAVFHSGAAGAQAAVTAQRRLRDHQWPAPVRVRMGLHVGFTERSRMGYVGLEVHRAARVAAAAHGGQLLLTRAAAQASSEVVDAEMLGVFRLKDFPVAEPLFCARIDGLGAADFPPPRTLDVRPTNLPAGRPQLIGREPELAAVRDAITTARAVTVSGRGGAGKTSLALVAAGEALDLHPGGVWWVELASVAHDGALAAIAAAVQARTRTEEPLLDALVRRFEGRGAVLLVLDNLEHLLSFVPALGALLDRALEVRLLTTSQAPLRLPGEVVVPLDSLPLPEALALFEAGASRTRAGFTIDPGERADVEAICHAVDRLPLALELVAARAGVLTPGQLRGRLDASLDLVRGGGARPGRQRSLAATVEWTLGMLDQEVQTLFDRLGAFAGPAELEELEVVAGEDGVDVFGAVSALVEFSLLSRVERGDGRLRFGLPTALHRLAADTLADSPDAHRWYRAHARRQLQRCWPARLLHMDTTREHLVAADAESEALLAIERMSGADPTLADALRAVVGLRLINLGRIAEAAPILRAIDADGVEDRGVRAVVALGHAMEALFTERPSLPKFDVALELALQSDPTLAVTVLALRSVSRIASDDAPGAIADATAASERATSFGGPVLAGALSLESQARLAGGEHELARARLESSAALAASCDATTSWAHDSLFGDIAFERGDLSEALRSYARSLQGAEARGDAQQIAYDLIALAGTLARLHLDESAAEVVGILDAHCMGVGATREQMLPVAVGRDEAMAALDRLGRAAEAPRQRGVAVAGGQRIARAVMLATTTLDRAALT